MYDLFGRKIEVEKTDTSFLYDYYLISKEGEQQWNFCEEWFINDWFAEGDFII